MRFLYFLEPEVEFDNPLFRFATIRNHLDREIRGLHAVPGATVEVTLICSPAVAQATRNERLLQGVKLVEVTNEELRRIYPDYLEASRRWYNRDFEPAQLALALELYSAKLAGYRPDVIVCYESNAPFLQELFPEALFLHNTLGIFSRSPFPETSALDPFGIGKDSYLSRFASELSALTLTDAESAQLQAFKKACQLAQIEHSPVLRERVRGGFERVVLLPLQVSRYFVYEQNCPEELRAGDQLSLLRYVLERVEPSVGVCVAMHPSEAELFTDEVRAELSARFPNFLADAALQRIRWPSQHLLPHVDAVVAVSSAVGLQALVWDLPVIALGRSHLRGIESGHSLEQLPALLAAGRTRRRDPALYHLLTHYYPLMDRYHHRGEWFLAFARHLKERAALGFDAFAPIDEPAAVFAVLTEELRPWATRGDMRRSAWHLAMTTAARDQNELIERVRSADVVSFDVFDTLVTRPLARPTAVFDLIARDASALIAAHGGQVAGFGGFRRLREHAGKLAASRARAEGREEYTLLEAYGVLCDEIEIQRSLASELAAIEEAAELASHRVRESGMTLFRAAQAAGRRILLVSDTFNRVELVASILERCGYSGYEKLFVSSDIGKLKRTGNLFEEIRSRGGVEGRWLHIGDNLFSDVQVPTRLGIEARHLPGIWETYEADAHVRQTFAEHDLGGGVARELCYGVISRKFFDEPWQPRPRSPLGASPYRLGYEAGGPLLLSFCLWLHERVQARGLTDVYFLARDGHILKQLYDLVATTEPRSRESLVADERPRSHYLLASRRAYSMASIRTFEDILQTLHQGTERMPLWKLLQERFGVALTELAPGSLEAAGLSADQLVSRKDHFDALRKIFSLNRELIFARADAERSCLMSYLEAEGLTFRERKIAVVDIGHHGSLQRYLAELLGRRDIEGYYLATFQGAARNMAEGLEMRGYLLDLEDNTVSRHSYCENLGMFELLLLPPLPSLIRLRQTADGVEPEFAAIDESSRYKVATEVHRGVLDFARDVVEASLGQAGLAQLSKNEALRNFERFVVRPDREDALMLAGVRMADVYHPDEGRYLIAEGALDAVTETNYWKFVGDSWWRAGAQAIAAKHAPSKAPKPKKPNKKPSPPKPAASVPSNGQAAAAAAVAGKNAGAGKPQAKDKAAPKKAGPKLLAKLRKLRKALVSRL